MNRRAWRLPGVAVAGLALGAGGVTVLQAQDPRLGPTGSSTFTTVVIDAVPSTAPRDTAAPTPGPVEQAPLPEPADAVLLVWTSGGLPGGFAAAAAELSGVVGLTVVDGDLVHLVRSWDASGAAVDATEPGFVIPLDVLAVDPASYARFLPATARAPLAELSAGEAILSTTSARLRGLDAGAALELADGTRFTVTAVVADELVGAAELVVARGEPSVSTERFLLVAYERSRTQLEQDIVALLPPGMPSRFRGPGETPFMRHGDAVLPQGIVKAQFGEFAYQPSADAAFQQDAAWIEANIVAEDVPILGSITCHRHVVAALQGALAELEERNLASLVDPAAFQGCWVPRLIGAGLSVSRHAWGVAVDLNVGVNARGQGSAQDPRLIEILDRWGFGWGGQWLVPDPPHFEYLRPPAP